MINQFRIKPVRSSAALKEDYFNVLKNTIDKMYNDSIKKIKAQFFESEPKEKGTSSKKMAVLLTGLTFTWNKVFKELSEKYSDKIIKKVLNHTDLNIKNKMKRQGIKTDLKFNKEIKDAYNAVVYENINLIQSLSARYFKNVTTVLMDSFSRGTGYSDVLRNLQDYYRFEKKHARIIARDQLTKANSVFVTVRQRELGVNEAIWRYTWRSKVPRIEHVKADNDVYDVNKGNLISGEYIYPGQLINCKCVSEWIVNK